MRVSVIGPCVQASTDAPQTYRMEEDDREREDDIYHADSRRDYRDREHGERDSDDCQDRDYHERDYHGRGARRGDRHGKYPYSVREYERRSRWTHDQYREEVGNARDRDRDRGHYEGRNRFGGRFDDLHEGYHRGRVLNAPTTVLMLRNLPPSVSESEIHAELSNRGVTDHVLYARLIRDRETGKFLQFAGKFC